MGPYWPISIIDLKRPYFLDIVTIVGIIFLGTALWKAFSAKRSFIFQLGIIWLLVLATNLLQGYRLGFVWPTDSKIPYEVNYWSDAQTIYDPLNFISHYTAMQPNLGYHGRVHPPLPALIMYTFQHVSSNAILASAILSIFSLGSVWCLYRWLHDHVPEQTAQFIALLFGISSAFQIYSMSTIDSVIAAVFTATLWLFDRSQKTTDAWLAAGLLFISCLFTFGAAWLIPVMLVIDYTKHKNLSHFIRVILIATGLLFVVYLTTQYSYIEGFLIAKKFENTNLFSFTPVGIMNYLSTRLADISEHVIFLGPYISLYLFHALKTLPKNIFEKASHFNVISLAAICSFLGFIATGAYYTGETARAALYIIPATMTILGPYFKNNPLSFSNMRTVFILVLGQTTLMQLFFFFNW